MTKAIVVFGGADEAAEAKKSVKASHNLKVGQIYFSQNGTISLCHPQTPGEVGKKTRKRVVVHQPPPPRALPAASSEASIPATIQSVAGSVAGSVQLPKPLTADRLISAPGSSVALMASSDFNTEQPEVALSMHNIFVCFFHIFFSPWRTTLTTHMVPKISLTRNKR